VSRSRCSARAAPAAAPVSVSCGGHTSSKIGAGYRSFNSLRTATIACPGLPACRTNRPRKRSACHSACRCHSASTRWGRRSRGLHFRNGAFTVGATELPGSLRYGSARTRAVVASGLPELGYSLPPWAAQFPAAAVWVRGSLGHDQLRLLEDRFGGSSLARTAAALAWAAAPVAATAAHEFGDVIVHGAQACRSHNPVTIRSRTKAARIRSSQGRSAVPLLSGNRPS